MIVGSAVDVMVDSKDDRSPVKQRATIMAQNSGPCTGLPCVLLTRCCFLRLLSDQSGV